MKSTKLSLIFALAIGVSFVAIGQNLKDSAGSPPIKDSTQYVADSVQIATQMQPTIVGLPVSRPVQSIFIAVITALATVLGAVQYVLKKIPTPVSVKIEGVVGKILDVATFFQPDRSTNGGVHADKPDPLSAPKKP